MLSSLPAPQPGQIQLVVFSEDAPVLLVSIQPDQLDSLIAGVEQVRGIPAEKRSDRDFQISGRIYIHEQLKRTDAAEIVKQHLAAEILYLAVHHFGQTGIVRRAIDESLNENSLAVVSVSITTGPNDSIPSTRWGVCVGTEPFDKRADVARLPAGDIHLFGTSVSVDEANKASALRHQSG